MAVSMGMSVGMIAEKFMSQFVGGEMREKPMFMLLLLGFFMNSLIFI
jgi:hypothetical protein